MGKPRSLPIPPICPTCGEIPTYSKFPYCSCECGNFVFEDGMVRPALHKGGNAGKREKKITVMESKQKPETWREYEESKGWLREEYEDS